VTVYLHAPTGLVPDSTYRIDTAAATSSAAAITRTDPPTTITGSLVTTDPTGRAPRFLGAAVTLYAKRINPVGGAVLGDPVILTGTLLGGDSGAVGDSTIGTADLQDGAVTAAKTSTAVQQSLAKADAALPVATATATYARGNSIGTRLRHAAAMARPELVRTVMTNPPLITQGHAGVLSSTLTKRYGWIADSASGCYTGRGGGPVHVTSSFYVNWPAYTYFSTGNIVGNQSVSNMAVEFYTDASQIQFRWVGLNTDPRGFMLEVDGQQVQGQPMLYDYISVEYLLAQFSVGTATIVASTGVFTTPTAHGLAVGDRVSLGAITTTTGVTAGTQYFVLTAPTSTTFTLSSTQVLNPTGAAGTALTLVGDGSTTAVCLAKRRKIRYEFEQGAGAFYGVYVHPADSVWAAPVGIRAALVGDSTGVQTGAGLANGGWHVTLGKLLGWGDVAGVAIGSTGWHLSSTPQAGYTFGEAQRVADVVTYNPDVILTSGSQNDNGRNVTELTAATLAGLRRYRAALPTVPIIIGGVHPSTTGPSAAVLANEAAVFAAVDAMADPNVFKIPIATATDTGASAGWITGTGRSGATTGGGNSDLMEYTDGAHMSQFGHDYWARRSAQAIRETVLTSSRLP